MIELPAANAYSLSRSSDRRLFVGAAIGTLVVVFVGFARTYFLKYLYDTPALRWLVPLHGAVMTFWFLAPVRRLSSRTFSMMIRS